MSYIEKPEISFYQHIGELFYAIAASDKVVRKSEYDALKKLVREEWSKDSNTKDEFDTDAIYQMEIVFDWFDYERMGAEECFDRFADYALDHKDSFTPERIDLIKKTANAIANAFSGKNKAELILLGKLELLFGKA